MRKVFFVALLAAGLCAQTFAATPQQPGPEMLRPPDFVKGLPALDWGMSFQEAKKAIERSGARPVGFKDSGTELAWEAAFDGMRGGGAVFFREGSGLNQLAVGLYAFDEHAALLDAWLTKLTGPRGEPNETHQDEFALTKVWRLKNGFALQLRTLKDAHSPVVKITWVRV